jgi:CBS domain-containing protein
MLQSKESCLPVIDETGVVLGMLTEADFLRWFVRNAAPCNCTPATYVSVD